MLKLNVVLFSFNCILVHSATLNKVQHSDDKRLKGRPLSDVPRSGVEGDYEYDHDAFLGDQLNSELNQLGPEESKRRLGIILDKIDTDNDGLVTQEELKSWIVQVQREETSAESADQWKEMVAPGNNRLSWKEFRNSTFGDIGESGYGLDLKEMVARDERRFHRADRDVSGDLDWSEFHDFLHPEESVYMSDIVVQESLEDMDTDKDGKISITEFIDDLWKAEKEDEPEPDWVSAEREHFSKTRDKDGDGFLSFDEMKDWLVPEDFDLPLVEAHHLIATVDTNQDEKLTRDEIMDRYEVFIGSKATGYGEMLAKHDEF